MIEPVLDPYKALSEVSYNAERSWPEELSTPEFMNYITQSYDPS